jgi:predicted DNA-binding transcriptional regulator YafY
METSGSYDIKRWILSFGSDAELLEPVVLRVQIKQELEEATKAYA